MHRLPLPPRKYSWYSFLLEAESTPGPWCGQMDCQRKIPMKYLHMIKHNLISTVHTSTYRSRKRGVLASYCNVIQNKTIVYVIKHITHLSKFKKLLHVSAQVNCHPRHKDVEVNIQLQMWFEISNFTKSCTQCRKWLFTAGFPTRFHLKRFHYFKMFGYSGF